jgi:hypothetical protein
MKLRLFSMALLCSTVFFITNCRTTKPADSGSFDRLRAAVSRVPGWIEKKDQYQVFKAEELYGIIDGGATEYIKQGLISGIVIACSSGIRSLGMYFEDFGTDSRAKGMVIIKKKSMSEPKVIPKVSMSPAMYEEVLGGCVAYWAKGRYYIEMTFTGYDSLDSAVRDAVMLIDSIGPVIGK